MSNYGAVLDACVLAPMPLAHTLLRLAARGIFRPYWSERTLDEVAATLGKWQYPEHLVRRRIDVMREYFPEALISGTGSIAFARGLPDPDDEHVLEAALKSDAQAIVTLNLRHFPTEVCDQFSVDVLDPDTFLINQYDLGSRAVRDILIEQVSATRKPAMTMTQLLDHLRRVAPGFAGTVETDMFE